MTRRLELVQRGGKPFQSAIGSVHVEMQRGPVREQQALIAVSVVGLDVTATGRAVVDAQSGFSLDDHALETLGVAFTKRAAGALEVPTSAAAAARQETLAAVFFTDELRHCRQRSAGGAIP